MSSQSGSQEQTPLTNYNGMEQGSTRSNATGEGDRRSGSSSSKDRSRTSSHTYAPDESDDNTILINQLPPEVKVDDKDDRPSSLQDGSFPSPNSSEYELKEAVTQAPEARNRHVRFNSHITESVSIIHRMLDSRNNNNNNGSSVVDFNHASAITTEPASESVLGSLLKLNAKRPSMQNRRAVSLYELPSRSSPDLHHYHRHPRKKGAKRWLNQVTSNTYVVPKLDKRKRHLITSSRRSSLDSVMTTASQFEPITIEDRVHIAFEIANTLQKHSFLRKLAKALMLYGCPAHRLEYILKHVSSILNITAEFVAVPNVMFITFVDQSTHTTETHFILQTSDFEMHKLNEIYRLAKLMAHGEVTVDEALEFIEQVEEDPPFYPVWAKPIIYALSSLCGCVMFFGGRWKEGGLSAAMAMFFALYELFTGRFWGFQPIWEITVCILIGFVTRAMYKYDFCFIPVAFSSFIVILPGYTMAISIIELVSRQLVSGVVRMVYAIIYCFLLGYGIEMGSELYGTIDVNALSTQSPVCLRTSSAGTCIAAESQWFYFLTVPLFAVSYCAFIKARPARWPVMIFVAASGFAVNWGLSCRAKAPQQVIQVVPAFAIGMMGNLLTKITGRMAFDATLVGIFFLVPGSLGLKAAIGLFGGKAEEFGSQGAGFALSMIESAIGITVGLFVATLIVYPKGAQHTPLMNF